MSAEASDYDHERTDARMTPVVLFAGGLALLSALVFLLMAWAFGLLEARATKRDGEIHPMVTNEPPPGPRLQANPGVERRAYEARMAALENEYGWVDPQAGLVRIPVERALDLLVSEELAKPKERDGE